jgi:uncharacterized protein YjbI with pentapeptide repeats
VTSTQAESKDYRVPPETYEQLAAASPAERAEIVLGLIRDHPQRRLVLPGVDGRHAMLDEIDLTRLTSGERIGPAGESVPREGGLRDADLRGASLRKANLQGVDLSNADLGGALLGQARLRHARLEGADLHDTDMAGVDLEDANLGEVNLRGAMLEEANLQNAALRFANLSDAVLENANLRGADLHGANLEDAVLTNADLQGAGLEEANLRRADFSGADLRTAVLKQTNVQESKLRSADLRGASLGGANLSDAILTDARLQEVDLTQCNITHVRLGGARLEDTRFQREQLGGAIGEELDGDYHEARKGYLALERAFQDLGDPDASSWAYRRRRRMQKHEALGRARSERAQGRWRAAAGDYTQFASDQFAEWLCDYGESLPRVLASLLVLYILFTFAYGLTGSVVREDASPAGIVRVTTQHPVDLAIFSLLAMTTGSLGIRLLPRNDLALTIVGMHVFLSVALIGLLGFVLGNRIRR